jgi:hypothetical protein
MGATWSVLSLASPHYTSSNPNYAGSELRDLDDTRMLHHVTLKNIYLCIHNDTAVAIEFIISKLLDKSFEVPKLITHVAFSSVDFKNFHGIAVFYPISLSCYWYSFLSSVVTIGLARLGNACLNGRLAMRSNQPLLGALSTKH